MNLLAYIWLVWVAVGLGGIIAMDVRDALKHRKTAERRATCRHDIHGCPENNRVIPSAE